MSLKVGRIEVLQCQVKDPEVSDPRYDGPEPSLRILEKGFKKDPDAAAFQAATVFEKDVKISLRDGVKIRADIFRPYDDIKIPALIAWSPYGKTGRGHFNIDVVPGRVGVPRSRVSGFEKFEAPDPAEWTARGYAIVNVDARGVYDSEGNICWWGSAEGRDGYDVVEELAKLPWCNGSIALVGNSWLSISQWFIAAERPPHLKCIAPLEGASDIYRELLCRGGIPNGTFFQFVAQTMCGRNMQEDVIGMLGRYPLMNEYWEDKRAKIDRINVPAYVLASYSTFLHTMGSFRAFEELSHDQKWLRVHSTQEWYDLYQESTNDELQKFFDKYTKGLDNGWELTPRVRVSLLGFNQDPIINHVFEDWPAPSTFYQELYLGVNGLLSSKAPAAVADISYQSDVKSLQMATDTEELSFEYKFPQRSYVLGCSRAVLFVSCNDSDDMDVFIQLRKADSDGNLLENINIPLRDLKIDTKDIESINPLKYLGPSGCLRASHAAIDQTLSTPSWPEHDYSSKNPVPKGKIVKMDIGIWQTGIIFDAGEKLVLKVSGHNMTLAEFPPLRGQSPNANMGQHHIHCGGANQSKLIIPLVEI